MKNIHNLPLNIIKEAIASKASDIHIEPRLKKYVVRYRVDGILQEVFELPQKADQAIVTRFKVLSRMDIAEHRRPQDGQFSISIKDEYLLSNENTIGIFIYLFFFT